MLLINLGADPKYLEKKPEVCHLYSQVFYYVLEDLNKEDPIDQQIIYELLKYFNKSTSVELVSLKCVEPLFDEEFLLSKWADIFIGVSKSIHSIAFLRENIRVIMEQLSKSELEDLWSNVAEHGTSESLSLILECMENHGLALVMDNKMNRYNIQEFWRDLAYNEHLDDSVIQRLADAGVCKSDLAMIYREKLNRDYKVIRPKRLHIFYSEEERRREKEFEKKIEEQIDISTDNRCDIPVPLDVVCRSKVPKFLRILKEDLASITRANWRDLCMNPCAIDILEENRERLVAVDFAMCLLRNTNPEVESVLLYVLERVELPEDPYEGKDKETKDQYKYYIEYWSDNDYYLQNCKTIHAFKNSSLHLLAVMIAKNPALTHLAIRLIEQVIPFYKLKIILLKAFIEKNHSDEAVRYLFESADLIKNNVVLLRSLKDVENMKMFMKEVA
jgi:hypothetical protein